MNIVVMLLGCGVSWGCYFVVSGYYDFCNSDVMDFFGELFGVDDDVLGMVVVMELVCVMVWY